MCEFFSCIATRDGRLLFTEENSHETIITRANLRDSDPHLRHWIRVEMRPRGEGWGPVWVDEPTTPEWWTEDRAAWEGKVEALGDRVRAALAAYEAARQSARAAYEAARQPAWAAYEAVEQSAWAAYEAVEQSAWAAYEAARQSAWAAYEAVEQSARAAYEAVQQPAWAAYEAALACISGHCAEIHA